MKNDNTHKKNALMCYHSSAIGGVETHILDIIEGLSKDFNIYVVCPDGELVEKYKLKGAVKHINLKPKNEFDLGYVFKIRALSKKYKIEIVHAHELKTGALAMFGAFLGRVRKRIYHVHTPFSQWKYSKLKRYYAIPINTFINFLVGNFFATDVIALNKTIAEHRNKKEFIRKNRIVVIPNGLRVKDFTNINEDKILSIKEKLNLRDHDYIIGNISRFTEEKGHERLLRSFEKFLSLGEINSSNMKLLLAGTGELKGNMEDLSYKLGISENVVFTGRFDEKDKSSLLSIMDMFIFPTYAEGFGYVMIEAFASKTPVLASDIQVLKGIAGKHIRYFSNSKNDFSNDIHRFYDFLLEKNNYHRIASDEYKIAEEYDIKVFWKNYKELYSS